MNDYRKITDEQLKKELRKGKDLKQIREEYGFDTDSGALSNRIRRNLEGFSKNYSFTLRENGITPYITDEVIRKAIKIKGLSKDRDQYFFTQSVNSDGDIVLSLTEQKWGQNK